MKFSIQSGDSLKASKAAIVVGVFDKGHLTPSATRLDKASQGFISKLIKQGDFQGKSGEIMLLQQLPHTSFQHVLLVGCGTNQPMPPHEFRKVIANSIRGLQPISAKEVIFCTSEIEVAEHDLSWKVSQTVQVCSDKLYQFVQYKTKPCPIPAYKAITLQIPAKANLALCKKALAQAEAISNGVSYTKNLANTPSNICTPTYLAEQAKLLTKGNRKFSIKVLDEKAMKKLGMGAFLAVAKGSDEDAKLVCIEYRGGKSKEAPVALVGKGITFDTGGNSLKPADAMVGMKYDMCGAASVLGTLKAAAELNLPINIVGILAAAENMPGGLASKPEDIVTTLSGQTVEIMNTDAEGRLVLCDALTYVERYKPEVVIDIATLTGAVVVALGLHATGLLSNNDGLAKALLKAGNESFDRAWQLPLWDEYQEQLKSPFADMSNVGGRYAGTITAACFLSRYAKKFKWAHLDVAGTAAMMGGNDRYATGRPVPLLTQFLIDRCKA